MFVGSFATGTLDLADIAALPATGYAYTRTSAFVHELVEQWEKQINKKPFIVAHKEALRAEYGITTSYRFDYDESKYNFETHIGSVTFKYRRVSKITKDGKQQIERKIVTQVFSIKAGNILKIKETEQDD